MNEIEKRFMYLMIWVSILIVLLLLFRFIYSYGNSVPNMGYN